MFAETNNVELGIIVGGNGSYDGTFQFQFIRIYENKTDTTQSFSEILSAGGVHDELKVGNFEVVSNFDGINVTEVDHGMFEMIGELKPNLQER